MTDSDEGHPKEKADVPPVLPGEKPASSEAGGVLSPEELDFTESPYVAEVSDGRYVVSADHSPPSVPEDRDVPGENSSDEPRSRSGTERRRETDRTGASVDRGQRSVRSPESARSILAEELDRVDSRLAIDIVSRFGDETVGHRITSDDVVRTFDNLVLWYAQNVARSTPTNRTASLLLAKSEFTAAPSPNQIRKTAVKHGLNRSSTIGELLEAIE